MAARVLDNSFYTHLNPNFPVNSRLGDNLLLEGEVLRKPRSRSVSQSDKTIHSGHFMVSNISDDDDDDNDDTAEVPNIKEEANLSASLSPSEVLSLPDEMVAANLDASQTILGVQLPPSGLPGAYDFGNAALQLQETYVFGSKATNQMSIDESLVRMFEHMKLAYSGKLSSPKWKHFKGHKVKLKDKIRLNNIIWREWHMQYIQRRNPVICQFEAPVVADKTHGKSEAVVLEGKYWKHSLKCLAAEYQKWRQFFKKRFASLQRDHDMEEVASHAELLDRLSHTRSPMPCPSQYFMDPAASLYADDPMLTEDDMPDFCDTLFSTLGSIRTPFLFPDPKEFAQLGFGDIVQPGLVQLQPSLGEMMDTSGIETLTSNMAGGRPPMQRTVSSDCQSDFKSVLDNVNSGFMYPTSPDLFSSLFSPAEVSGYSTAYSSPSAGQTAASDDSSTVTAASSVDDSALVEVLGDLFEGMDQPNLAGDLGYAPPPPYETAMNFDFSPGIQNIGYEKNSGANAMIDMCNFSPDFLNKKAAHVSNSLRSGPYNNSSANQNVPNSSNLTNQNVGLHQLQKTGNFDNTGFDMSRDIKMMGMEGYNMGKLPLSTSQLIQASRQAAGSSGDVLEDFIGNHVNLNTITGQQAGQLVGQLTGQPTGQLVGQLTGQPVRQLAGQTVGRPTGQAVGQPTGQLAGQPAGQREGGARRGMDGRGLSVEGMLGKILSGESVDLGISVDEAQTLLNQLTSKSNTIDDIYQNLIQENITSGGVSRGDTAAQGVYAQQNSLGANFSQNIMAQQVSNQGQNQNFGTDEKNWAQNRVGFRSISNPGVVQQTGHNAAGFDQKALSSVGVQASQKQAGFGHEGQGQASGWPVQSQVQLCKQNVPQQQNLIQQQQIFPQRSEIKMETNQNMGQVFQGFSDNRINLNQGLELGNQAAARPQVSATRPHATSRPQGSNSGQQGGFNLNRVARSSPQPVFNVSAGKTSPQISSIGNTVTQNEGFLYREDNTLLRQALTGNTVPKQPSITNKTQENFVVPGSTVAGSFNKAGSTHRSSVSAPSGAQSADYTRRASTGSLGCSGGVQGVNVMLLDGRVRTTSGGSTGGAGVGVGVVSGARSKKHVSFVVPPNPAVSTVKSDVTRSKPRPIAPAPGSTTTTTVTGARASDSLLPGVSNNSGVNNNNNNGSLFSRTILEGLLKFEDDTQRPAPRGGAGLKPIAQRLPVSSASNVTDFQRHLVMAAASQAVGSESIGLGINSNNNCDQEGFLVPTPRTVFSGSGLSNMTTISTNDMLSTQPGGVARARLCDDSLVYGDDRLAGSALQLRTHHMTAEQRRRGNIKSGFDMLNQIVPSLIDMSSAKINKATTLQKTADMCRRMKREREAAISETEKLRQEIIVLQQEINVVQSQLPASGLPVVRAQPQSDRLVLMCEEYVRARTINNWKFWIFSFIIRPLFQSYTDHVVTSSVDDLCRTCLMWLDKHCSLVSLRPAVLNSLRQLSKSTSILSDPRSVVRQASQSVQPFNQPNT